ncbi:MAG: sugar ABC transporter permease [Anaerolineales bacterium]|nr:sugar ABC transporter permease [Anaerolineae bacterium]PWB50462.1 MAG: sugar ABC transporter permease [Anaerolineales bacterium]
MAKIKALTREIRRGWSGYLFIAPGYLAFFMFMLAPILFAISLSFYKASFDIGARQFVGLSQYVQLSKDPVFKRALVNTISYAFVIVPATVFISLVIAFLIDPLGRKAQAFFRGAFYIPGVAGGVVLSVVFLWIFNPTYGVLNYLLGLVGMKPILWLATPPHSFQAVCAVVLTFTIGAPIILFEAGLAGISQDILDAATVDGANYLQKAWFIRLPLLRPVLLFVLATQTIQVFQLWEVIYMVTGGGPYNTSTSLVYLIFQTAFLNSNYGKASAIGVVLMVIILFFTAIQLRFWRSTDI